MNISILVMSCDKYKDCYKPFFTLKDKYWKDCPYKTYLGTETIDCEYAETIKTQGSWTSRVKQTLEQINSEYILFMLDDFFIRSKVDQKRIEEIKFDNNTAVYNFERDYKNIGGFSKRQNKTPYLCSCQPSLWNRKKLIELLQDDKTAWQWETQIIDSKYDFYINSGNIIIDIGYNEDKKPWGIVQGKWTEEAKLFLQKENIKLDEISLSIIIPYYKTLDMTKSLLNVLCEQLKANVEVILVDDGCNELELDKYPIKVIHQENGGVSKARNTGLDIAQGKYIAFVDSDDMISKDYVEKILDKIQENFDYCYMSWKSIGTSKETFIIKDKPPDWNHSVWKCIYKKSMIGNTRFNENKKMAEEEEFNLKCIKGIKANIEDVMYYYNNGREGSLINRYSKGEITKMEEIKTQIVIYRSFLSLLGGIETAVYNACNLLNKYYDIIFLYDTADAYQLNRLKKVVKCVKVENQKISCDIIIYYGLSPKLPSNVESKKIIQHICCDMVALNYRYTAQPGIIYTADSQGSANSFMELHPGVNCGILYNLFDIPEPKKMLHLMTASRLSPEKGYSRMRLLALRLNQRKIPFIWTIFTNDKFEEVIDGVIFMKPRLNVQQYMWGQDFGIQLSDTESWGCTVTEFLERGVPVICTRYRSASEQVEEGLNGYIMELDMSNLDDIIDKMLANDLKGFEYHKKDSVEQWKGMLGNMKKKDNYKYIESGLISLEVLCVFQDRINTTKYYKKGDIIEVTKERAEELLANPANLVKEVN